MYATCTKGILVQFVGTWLDLTPAVIIFTPILLPIVTQLGIDPVHFGVIMVVNLAIGLFTPPVGVCLLLVVLHKPVFQVLSNHSFHSLEQ